MDLLQPMMIAALLLSGMGVALLGSLKVPSRNDCKSTRPE